jgi:ADP-ribosyl-[dinitrogen reductase] hydrolase
MADLDRYRGCLLGLAVGDALGAALESRPRGTFTPVSDMVGGGPFELEPGQWTDDTSMALCLAESLIACDGFDAEDQMLRYARWYHDGYLSSTGVCFDIGNTCRSSLERFEQTGDPFAGSTDPKSAGNGSIMRLAPAPMRWATDLPQAIEMAARSSETTHGAIEAVDACRLLATVIVGCLQGDEKTQLFDADGPTMSSLLESSLLAPKIAALAYGEYLAKDPEQLRSTGYVVDTLELALWCFVRTDSFRDGALMAVNHGGDADTVGAVYGQIAGAFYGLSEIPDMWLGRLSSPEKLLELANGLCDAAMADRGGSDSLMVNDTIGTGDIDEFTNHVEAIEKDTAVLHQDEQAMSGALAKAGSVNDAEPAIADSSFFYDEAETTSGNVETENWTDQLLRTSKPEALRQRAYENAMELGEKYHWTDADIECLRSVFEKYTWPGTKLAIERELLKGLKPCELTPAVQMRDIWVEVSGARFPPTWPVALKIVRAYIDIPDEDELELFASNVFSVMRNLEYRSRRSQNPAIFLSNAADAIVEHGEIWPEVIPTLWATDDWVWLSSERTDMRDSD